MMACGAHAGATASNTMSLPLSDAEVEGIERATLEAVVPDRLESLPGWLVPGREPCTSCMYCLRVHWMHWTT